MLAGLITIRSDNTINIVVGLFFLGFGAVYIVSKIYEFWHDFKFHRKEKCEYKKYYNV